MQKRQFTKKKRRHDLSSPLQDLRENMKISSIRFWELFYLEFPPFFLFYQGKFVFPEQFLFICIKLKYLKFRRSPVGGKKWRLVGNWNPKGKKTKKKQKKDKSVSRSKKKRFILSFFTFFSILLSLVIFVLFKHIRAGPRFFFFCFFLFFFVTSLEKTDYQHVLCSVRAEILFLFCDMEVLEDPQKSLFV